MNQDQARRMAEEVELPFSPYLYMEWVSATERKTSTMYTADQVREAIAAALVKLTQGQEPFGWYDANFSFDHFVEGSEKPTGDCDWKPLYTHPIPSQQEERKPLAEREIAFIVSKNTHGTSCPEGCEYVDGDAIAKDIEAAHNIKDQQ